MKSICVPRRATRLLPFLLFFSLLAGYLYFKSRPPYALYRKIERNEIEQSRKFAHETPEKRRYVKFKQLQGAGFNNQAQEILLFHHLALLSSRTYVYQPIVWRARGEQALVPLSAFLRGPTRDTTISDAIFDDICPPDDTKHLRLGSNINSNLDLWSHALETLSNHPASCLAIDDWILDWTYLASPAIHLIWPSFKTYLARHFAWSEQIDHIASRVHSQLSLRTKPHHEDGEPYMALHFRRGDFEAHCHSLANDGTRFTTWLTLPALASSVFPPFHDPSNGTSTIEHCYPDLSRIVSIIDMHARARPHLRTLHILHDGAWDHPLVYYQKLRLEAGLKTAGRVWPGGPLRRVTHSGMLPLKSGEADWAVTVDVELARNAEVFIGNGFSSLSSQVVALRLGADGGRVEDITLL